MARLGGAQVVFSKSLATIIVKFCRKWDGLSSLTIIILSSVALYITTLGEMFHAEMEKLLKKLRIELAGHSKCKCALCVENKLAPRAVCPC